MLPLTCQCGGECGDVHVWDGEGGVCSAPNGQQIWRLASLPASYTARCPGGLALARYRHGIVVRLAEVRIGDESIPMCQRCLLLYYNRRRNRQRKEQVCQQTT